MHLTTSNAGEYLGKRLDAERRLFHHYPLTVGRYPDGSYYYRDAVGVCIPVPSDTDHFNAVRFDFVIETEAVEVCPFCGAENSYPNWDVEKQGYEAVCQHCGSRMMLCDECLHADDNPGGLCDWTEGDGCFRARMKEERV